MYKSKYVAKVKKFKQTPPAPKVADIVSQDGSRIRFFSVRSARRVIAKIIADLSPKKTPDEPKKVWIEK